MTNQPGKPRMRIPEHVRDPLVAAERRHLAEHPVAYGCGSPARFFARRRAWRSACWQVGGSTRPGRRLVRHGGAVAERPEPLVSLDAQERIDADAPALVERQAELAEHRVRLHAGRPDERVRRDALAVRQDGLVCGERLERRRDVDLDAAPCELPRRVVAEPRRDLGQDLRRRVDEHPALSRRRAGAGSSAARRRRGRRARRAPRRPRSRHRRRRRTGAPRGAPDRARRRPPRARAGRGCGDGSRRPGP